MVYLKFLGAAFVVGGVLLIVAAVRTKGATDGS